MKFSTMFIPCIYFLQFAIMPTQLSAAKASRSQDDVNHPQHSCNGLDVLHGISCMGTAFERKQQGLREFEAKHHLPNSNKKFLKNARGRSQPVCLVVVNDKGVRAVAIHYIELFGLKFFYSNIKGLGADRRLVEDVVVKTNFHDKNGLLQHLNLNTLIEKTMSKYKDYCILLLSNFVRLDRYWTCEYFKHNNSSTPLLENYPNPATFKNGSIGHKRTELHFCPKLIDNLKKQPEPTWDEKRSLFVANMYLTHNEANSDLAKENDFLAYCKSNHIGISPAIEAFLYGAEPVVNFRR